MCCIHSDELLSTPYFHNNCDVEFILLTIVIEQKKKKTKVSLIS